MLEAADFGPQISLMNADGTSYSYPAPGAECELRSQVSVQWADANLGHQAVNADETVMNTELGLGSC